MQEAIEIGYQVFIVDGGEDFVVPITAVEAVHSQKVILNSNKLEPRLQQAIRHAHDAEQPGS